MMSEKNQLLIIILLSSLILLGAVGSEFTFKPSPYYFEELVCPATPPIPRDSEAAMIELKNGNLLLAYTEFYDGKGDDGDTARISGKISSDGGLNWGKPFVIIPNTAKMNVCQPSLLRLK